MIGFRKFREILAKKLRLLRGAYNHVLVQKEKKKFI